MVEPTDISQAILTRISGDATLSAAIPGDLWYGRAPEAADRPYGTIRVDADEPERADVNYFRRFAVTLTVFMASTEDVPGVQRGLEGLFEQKGSLLALPVASGGTVLSCVVTAPDLELDPELRSGVDVARVVVGVEVRVWGTYP